MANILIDQTKELQGDEELEITLRMWKLYSKLMMIRHDKIVEIQYMIMYSEKKEGTNVHIFTKAPSLSLSYKV